MSTPGLNLSLRDVVRVVHPNGTRDIGRVVSMMEWPDKRPVQIVVECLNGEWSGNARDVLLVRTDEANRWFVSGLAFS